MPQKILPAPNVHCSLLAMAELKPYLQPAPRLALTCRQQEACFVEIIRGNAELRVINLVLNM